MQKQSPRWLAPLYVALAIAQLIPIWSVRYLPTCDGPSHVYNSWVLRELALGRGESLGRWFSIDWRPNPNWIGHAALALLMTIVPPTVAEKILVSAIVLLFLAAVWIFVGPDRRPFAFLAFPFAFHAMLQSGFYNFSISLALYLIVVAVWWRRRDHPAAANIALIAALLLLCYFSHPMSTALAIGSIGLLWLSTLRGRRHFLHLIALVPAALFLVWFARQRGMTSVSDTSGAREAWTFLARTQILFTFDLRQLAFGRVFFVVWVALIVITLAWRREANAFLLLFAVMLVLYFVSPSAVFGGQLLRERMALFVMLVPLAWITPRLPRPAIVALVVAMSLVALLNAAFLTRRYRHFDPVIAEVVESARRMPAGSTVLPLLFVHQPPGTAIGILTHVVDYAAIERHAVNLDNYEAGTDYFPTRFRSGVEAPDIVAIESAPWAVKLGPFVSRGAHIFTWKMPPRSPLRDELAKHYRLIASAGEGTVWRTLAPPSGALAASDLVLLPLAGTTHDVGGPFGARWRVDQTVRNRGREPVHVVLSACAATTSCDFELASGQMVPLASDDESAPFLVVFADRGRAAQLEFSTIARRTDPQGIDVLVSVPAVPEPELGHERITVPGVICSPDTRLTLRTWTIGEKSTALTVRLRSEDSILAEATIAIGRNGASTASLDQVFGEAARRDRRVNVEVVAPGRRVWAFVSGTTGSNGSPTQYFPLR